MCRSRAALPGLFFPDQAVHQIAYITNSFPSSAIIGRVSRIRRSVASSAGPVHYHLELNFYARWVTSKLSRGQVGGFQASRCPMGGHMVCASSPQQSPAGFGSLQGPFVTKGHWPGLRHADGLRATFFAVRNLKIRLDTVFHGIIKLSLA